LHRKFTQQQARPNTKPPNTPAREGSTSTTEFQFTQANPLETSPRLDWLLQRSALSSGAGGANSCWGLRFISL